MIIQVFSAAIVSVRRTIGMHLKQKVPLCQWQALRCFAAHPFAVDGYLVGLRVDVKPWQIVITAHIRFGQLTTALYWKQRFR